MVAVLKRKGQLVSVQRGRQPTGTEGCAVLVLSVQLHKNYLSRRKGYLARHHFGEAARPPCLLTARQPAESSAPDLCKGLEIQLVFFPPRPLIPPLADCSPACDSPSPATCSRLSPRSTILSSRTCFVSPLEDHPALTSALVLLEYAGHYLPKLNYSRNILAHLGQASIQHGVDPADCGGSRGCSLTWIRIHAYLLRLPS